MFLIDTDVLSALRRRDRNPAIVRWVEGQRTTDLHISVVTVGEIERGITQQQRHNPAFARDLAVWLDRVLAWYGDRILPVDAATARRWGQLSRPVEKAQETKAVVPDSIYNVPVRRCSEAINLLRATHYSYRQLTYRAPSPYPEAIAARSLMTAGPGGPIPPSLRTAFEKLCASADM